MVSTEVRTTIRLWFFVVLRQHTSSMVETNLKIISDLKAFLALIVNEPEFKNGFTKNPSDFTRNRKLSLAKVVCLIFNFLKRSLTIELDEFFSTIDCASPTKGAFSLQRTKLLPVFFKFWNYLFVKSFYHHYAGNFKRWRGFLLLSVDGSTEYLFNNPEIVNHFGTHNNQHTDSKIPMARVMKVFDVLNDIILWGDLFPIAKSEQEIINENIHQLPVGSLSIFDRGFPSFALIYLLQNQEQPLRFVMRCKQNAWKEITEFVRSSEQSKLIKIKASSNAIETLRKNGFIITSDTTIEVKAIKVQLKTGEIEVLITNLFENYFTIEDFKNLYAMRWGIEGLYGKLKNQLQAEIFSGHRVLCLMQDFYASIFMMNLQSIIKKQCDPSIAEINKRRKFDYQVNNNISWAKMKNNILKLFLEKNPREILLHLQNRFIKDLEPIRPNRSLPRTYKQKKLWGKYQTYTNYRRAL